MYESNRAKKYGTSKLNNHPVYIQYNDEVRETQTLLIYVLQ